MSDRGVEFGRSVADFDYELPPELIAQTPLADRDASRLLVVERTTGRLHHATMRDIGHWLAAGDLLVANNSRVLPARLVGRKVDTGGRVELLLLRALESELWTALARPARRLRAGVTLRVPPRTSIGLPDLSVEITAVKDDGLVEVRILGDARLDDYGEAPLPPYIRERLDDPERYQTVYASALGSAAAPTAGLHFTTGLVDDLRARGIGWAEVTLHVGLDTFRPVTVERVGDHRIHREWCSVANETAAAIAAARQRGTRVVAVGTTVARTLETLGRNWDPLNPAGMTAMTDLFIVSGYRWRLVDGMLTNFHLPRSTLLMMVSALAGIETIKRAYEEAIRQRYRFFSFGDAMLIL